MMDEDITDFFDAAEFADAATLDGRAVLGIFTRPYAEVLGIASAAPQFVIAAADLQGAGAGSSLVHNGTAYKLATPEPDGSGLVRLALRL
jgi:hypothetical protein